MCSHSFWVSAVGVGKVGCASFPIHLLCILTPSACPAWLCSRRWKRRVRLFFCAFLMHSHTFPLSCGVLRYVSKKSGTPSFPMYVFHMYPHTCWLSSVALQLALEKSRAPLFLRFLMNSHTLEFLALLCGSTVGVRKVSCTSFPMYFIYILIHSGSPM